MSILYAAGNIALGTISGCIAFKLLARDNSLNILTKTVITAGTATCYNFALKRHNEWLAYSTMLSSREIELYKDLGLFVTAMGFGLWIVCSKLKSGDKIVDIALFSWGCMFLVIAVKMFIKFYLNFFTNENIVHNESTPVRKCKC